jgi:glycolate oxidase iron-sulfur subunit
MELALAPARLLKAMGGEKWLPKFLREALSLIPDDSKGAALPEISPALTQERRARVGFVSGCVMSVMFRETNANSVKLLNQAGCDVVTPKEQLCCGALYAHSGQLDQARACARQNIAAFEKLELDAIVINAAGCGSTLKEYHRLLHGDVAWEKRASAFSSKVKDLTEWLTEGGFRVDTPVRTPVPVTYHDACHLAHAQRITKPPRELVRSVAGKNFVELPESDVCCGSAGSYNLTEPDMAGRLQRRKIENILKTGAKIVVTTNPGCILQIRAGLKKAGAAETRVVHVADYLLGG